MATSLWRIAPILCGALWACSSTIAGPIQGVVVNKDGKPVPYAEVRADRADADAAAKRYVTTTSSDGRYMFASLPNGRYAITVIAQNGAHTEARIATVGSTLDNGQPVRRFISALPYQVKPDFSSGTTANVRTRYVWQPGETGSHIGGRWIKVRDAEQPTANPLDIIVGNDFTKAPVLQFNKAAK